MPRGLGDTTRLTSSDRASTEQSDRNREGADANTPEEVVIDGLVAHRDTPTSMEYKVR